MKVNVRCPNNVGENIKKMFSKTVDLNHVFIIFKLFLITFFLYITIITHNLARYLTHKMFTKTIVEFRYD
ncbi:hypothetical protein N779_14605 [Vibrio coralliilyticus OCN008]|nr:hypothetical protein N779_14605 [Vibrio coralliilyticus OCN008]